MGLDLKAFQIPTNSQVLQFCENARVPDLEGDGAEH